MFPTPTATAFTIRALHAGRSGAEAARKKSIGLASSFGAAFVFKIAAGYLPGVIWDWHIGWTFYRLGWTSMIQLDNFGWWPECMFLFLLPHTITTDIEFALQLLLPSSEPGCFPE